MHIGVYLRIFLFQDFIRMCTYISSKYGTKILLLSKNRLICRKQKPEYSQTHARKTGNLSFAGRAVPGNGILL